MIQQEIKNNDIDTQLNNDTSEIAVSVRSLWKIYGDDPEKVLTDEYANRSKSEILDELGNVVALQDVTFDVQKGETFVVMGLSGSGKSTLVRCLIRLIEPVSGQIVIDSEDILTYDEKELASLHRRKTAMVFQHFGLLPHRNVKDNVSWGLEIRGDDKESRDIKAQEYIDLVGLTGWENAYPRALSGGMQQRVGLARALAVEPEILLMDEPFSGLDPLIRTQMQDELLRIQKDLHKTIIFITHDLTEAVKLGDRIVIMRDGKVIQNAPPLEVLTNPADDYVAEFTRNIRSDEVVTAGSIATSSNATLKASDSIEDVVGNVLKSEHQAYFVLGSEDEFLGIVLKKQFVNGNKPDAGTVKDMCDPEIKGVYEEVAIRELVPMAITYEGPIPVVNDEGKFVGEISRAALADQLQDSE